jgi:hypothetical protein
VTSKSKPGPKPFAASALRKPFAMVRLTAAETAVACAKIKAAEKLERRKLPRGEWVRGVLVG